MHFIKLFAIRSNSTLLGVESAHQGDIKEFHGFQGSDNGSDNVSFSTPEYFGFYAVLKPCVYVDYQGN